MAFLRMLSSISSDMSQKLNKTSKSSQLFDVNEITPDKYEGLTSILKLEECQVFKVKGDYQVVLQPCGCDKQFEIFKLGKESETISVVKEMAPRLKSFFEQLAVVGARDEFLSDSHKIRELCCLVRKEATYHTAHLAAALGISSVMNDESFNEQLKIADEMTRKKPLQVAIESEQLDFVKQILDNPNRWTIEDLSTLDKEGLTILHVSAVVKNPRILETLLAHVKENDGLIAALNSNGETALHEACLAGRPENLELLLQYMNPEQTIENELTKRGPIHCAVQADDIRCTEMLCSHSSEQVNLKTKGTGDTPFHLASSTQVIQTLSTFGGDLEAKNLAGDTALAVKIRQNAFDLVFKLLSLGAYPDARSGTGDNIPLLHLVVEQDNPDVIQLLLIFGSDANSYNSDGVTVRHKAATSNGKHKDLILHYLHVAGAKRCDPVRKDCNNGCSMKGNFNGKSNFPIPPGQEPQKPFKIMAEMSAMTAALGRVADKCEPGHHPDELGKAGDRVLCLDGGSLRGIVEIMALMMLEQHLECPLVESFDWIAGTNFGGMVASLLIKGKTSRECLCFVFKLRNLLNSCAADAQDEALEQFLKYELGSDTMITVKERPKLILASTMADQFPPKLHFFRNYTIPGYELEPSPAAAKEKKYPPLLPPSKQPLWMAVLDSGISSSLPFVKSNGRFLNGALASNNTTVDVLAEIHNFNMADKMANSPESSRPLHVVVSLGTGYFHPEANHSQTNFDPAEVRLTKTFASLSELESSLQSNDLKIASAMQQSFGKNLTVNGGVSYANNKSADDSVSQSDYVAEYCYEFSQSLIYVLLERVYRCDGDVVENVNSWCSMMSVPHFRISPRLSHENAFPHKFSLNGKKQELYAGQHASESEEGLMAVRKASVSVNKKQGSVPLCNGTGSTDQNHPRCHLGGICTGLCGFWEECSDRNIVGLLWESFCWLQLQKDKFEKLASLLKS